MKKELFDKMSFEEQCLFRLEKSGNKCPDIFKHYSYVFIIVTFLFVANAYKISLIFAYFGTIIASIYSVLSFLIFVINDDNIEKRWTQIAINRIKNDKENI